MGEFIKHFSNLSSFKAERYGENYEEPWVSYTDNDTLKYNKTEYETLLHTPLTFVFKGTGTLYLQASNENMVRTMEYSKNGGAWTTISSAPSNASYLSVENGDTIALRGDNNAYCDGNNYRTALRVATCQFDLQGNIMSLINSTGYADMTTFPADYAFGVLFGFNTTLIDASKLILPATYLRNRCYYNMFNGCTNLVYGPELPKNITAMESQAMKSLFYGCSSLVRSMSSIGNTTTILANNCCGNMFENCSSLTTAPDLPAPTLTTNSYEGMFIGCSSLTRIKCLLTNPYPGWQNNWVTGISATGTFIKKEGVTWERGVRGIPTGWDVNVLS